MIQVNPKRTNTPGLSSTNRPPRGSLRGARRGAYMAEDPRGCIPDHLEDRNRNLKLHKHSHF